MNVLPAGTTPLVIDEAGRAQSPGTLKFLEYRGKREMRAAKAIPPVQLSDAAPAVRDALALHAARRTEIQERQQQLPGLLKAVRDRSAYLSAADVDGLRKLHDDCVQLLVKTSGQGRVTVDERDTALLNFETLKTKALELQKKADDAQAKEMADGLAELVTLMQEVEKLGEDIDPAERDGFRKYHDACRIGLADAANRVPLSVAERTRVTKVLAGVRSRAEKLQEQAKETRNVKAGLAALRTRADEVGQRAFKPTAGSPAGERQVLDVLKFDEKELNRLQGEVATAIAALKDEKRPTQEQVDRMRTKLELLELRVAESHGFLEDISPLTPDKLEDPKADPKEVNRNMGDAWRQFKVAAGLPGRDMDYCRERIAFIRSEIDRKAEVTENQLIELINRDKKKKGPVEQILQRLLNGAQKNKAVLKKCLEIEPRTAVLEQLFTLTDVPSRLPGLLASAMTIGLTSEQVQAVLQQRAHSTADADTLCSMIRKTTKSATWFLTGEGGQTLNELIRILLKERGQVWSGQTRPAPTYGPLHGPAVTFDHITNYAVPMVGASRPAPGGYAGNREYGNGGVAPDMALPSRTPTGAAITYTEYDIRPYYPGVDRGPLRVVVGSDDRKYYTANHYNSFGLIT